MPLRAMLRINPAVWISPFLVALAIIVSYSDITMHMAEPYSLALAATGASSVFLIAPICAACSAWEAGRLRRAEWFGLPHTRSPLAVALASLAPGLLVGLAAVWAAMAVKLLGAGAGVVPDSRVVVKTVAIITAHALLGFAVGLHVPVVVAAPAILLLEYCWMVLPIALQPLWLRHLNGAWFTCCSVSSDLALQAFVGVLVVAGGLASSALLLMRQRFAAPYAALAVAPTALAFALAASLVHGLGPDPVVARSVSALVCSNGKPRVCVWPEHGGRLAEVSEIAAQASNVWRGAGVEIPAQWSEWSSFGLEQRSFGFSLESRRSDIILSLAYSLLPPYPTCALDGRTPFRGGEAEPYGEAWLAEIAGVSRAEIDTRFGSDVLHAVDAVRSLPLDQQRIWLKRNMTALGTCDAAPRLEPGV
jgi:hypothetical protein